HYTAENDEKLHHGYSGYISNIHNNRIVEESKKNALSTGAVIGIAIACLVVVLSCVGLLYCCIFGRFRKCRSKNTQIPLDLAPGQNHIPTISSGDMQQNMKFQQQMQFIPVPQNVKRNTSLPSGPSNVHNSYNICTPTAPPLEDL
ncbi:uncharacterized protein LOC118199000, partial [Stegodyphus dumicola]|uniref:uncharacterized protein LOC118199000 n=1 Tax=Stegodyphus dumicola TaxID=202533 RepID=UPI0015A7D060